MKISARKSQQGTITLFALIALLLMFLGALYTFRGDLIDTSLTDKAAVRQKNVQVSYMGLQWLTNQIMTASGGNPLEIFAQGQPWYLSTQNPITPNPQYWSDCRAGWQANAVCASIPMPSGISQQAWGFVQPTGRVDPYACNSPTFTGMFYDVWIHVVDPRTGVAADTESLYKLCVPSQQ